MGGRREGLYAGYDGRAALTCRHVTRAPHLRTARARCTVGDVSRVENADELLDRLAVHAARRDQARAQVLEEMRREPYPEQLDRFLSQLDAYPLELRDLRATLR